MIGAFTIESPIIRSGGQEGLQREVSVPSIRYNEEWFDMLIGSW